MDEPDAGPMHLRDFVNYDFLVQSEAARPGIIITLELSLPVSVSDPTVDITVTVSGPGNASITDLIGDRDGLDPNGPLDVPPHSPALVRTLNRIVNAGGLVGRSWIF